MAIYHASVKSFSRGKGQSGTAAAAYRAGLRIEDERTGKVHDYTRRGGVVGFEMLAPKGAPDWCRDPAKFWNESEKAETRANARTGREVEVSLPHELTPDQRRALAHDLGQAMVDRYGVAAMVAIHEPHSRGEDQRNHHGHILLSARQVGPDGLGGRAMAEFDARKGVGADAIRDLREAVGVVINRHLEAAKVAARVSHLSLKERAREHLARGDYDMAAAYSRTPTTHEGKATTEARRSGTRLDRAQMNDGIRLDNRLMLDEYLKTTRGEGRIVSKQQQVDDLIGQPARLRRTLGGATGKPEAAPKAGHGAAGTAVHVEAGHGKVAKVEGGKSREQRAEAKRAARAQELMQRWMAATTRLSEMYLDDVRKAMQGERRHAQIADQIFRRLAQMSAVAARKEAIAKFREESRAWRSQRRHMRQFVRQRDRLRDIEARRQAHRQGVVDREHARGLIGTDTVTQRMAEWQRTHREPGRMLHRAEWEKWEKKRQRYLHAVRAAEHDRRKAEACIMTDADIRALDDLADIAAAEQRRLEARRARLWPVEADREPAAKPTDDALHFPTRKPPTPAVSLAQAVGARPGPSVPPPVPPPPRPRPRG